MMLIAAVALGSCGGNSDSEVSPEKDPLTDPIAEEDEIGFACGGPTGEVYYSDSAIGTLKKIIDNADGLPTVIVDTLSVENAPAMLGLLKDDFATFILEAAAATCESDEIAFQAVLAQLREEGDAEMIAGLIQTGFDPGKWVYVFPDSSLTAVSGPYLLLAVGSGSETQALADAFKTVIGGSATITVFYEGETGG